MIVPGVLAAQHDLWEVNGKRIYKNFDMGDV
jgi:hypothetical protein